MVTKKRQSINGGNDHDGFLSEKGGDNSARYRILRLEKDCEDLESFSDELRLDRTTLEVSLAQLKLIVERHGEEIIEARKNQVDLATQLTARLDELRSVLNERINLVEKTINESLSKNKEEFVERVRVMGEQLGKQIDTGLRATNEKLDENQTSNSRWLLGAVASVAFLFLLVFITIITHTFGGLP